MKYQPAIKVEIVFSMNLDNSLKLVEIGRMNFGEFMQMFNIDDKKSNKTFEIKKDTVQGEIAPIGDEPKIRDRVLPDEDEKESI